MHLSVIVPAYNEAKSLSEIISKIQFAMAENGMTESSWELIVCDNNSSDKTAKVAQESGAIVVFESINQISRARNIGASIAKGEWLLFIDADSYPKPELIQEVLNLIDSGKYIGCGTTVEVIGGTRFNKLRMERLNPLMRWMNWSGGAFILCETEAFKEIEGFSTGLYALEEIDFIIRLRKYGRKVKQKFTVLYRYPVITSGRKGDYKLGAILTLFLSNVLAILFLILYWISPKKWRLKGKGRLLGFWYGQRKG